MTDGEWLSKLHKDRHLGECVFPDSRDYGIGSLWRCSCGTIWKLSLGGIYGISRVWKRQSGLKKFLLRLRYGSFPRKPDA